jgi:hypothetical protein
MSSIEDDHRWPQAGRERQICPSAVSRGTGEPDREREQLARLSPEVVMMMGDNPALPRMPERPRLIDFFKYRLHDICVRHLLTSARRALDEGHDEKIVLACLLHDISLGGLIRGDHGYWGEQMIAPYVDEEVAWAVKYHQPLRFYPDEKVGYTYPVGYVKFFGGDYEPPEYIRRDAEIAQNHRWYMSARVITCLDVYFFEPDPTLDPEVFTDVIGRSFREPEEGLGFDNSPAAHMWRTMIWPNNFL